MWENIAKSHTLPLCAAILAFIFVCTAGCTSTPGGNVTGTQTATTTPAYQDAEFRAAVQASLPVLDFLIGAVEGDLATRNLTLLGEDASALAREAVRYDNQTLPMIVSPSLATARDDYLQALNKLENAGASADRAILEQTYSEHYGTNPLTATYLQQTTDYLSEGRQLLRKVATEIGT